MDGFGLFVLYMGVYELWVFCVLVVFYLFFDFGKLVLAYSVFFALSDLVCTDDDVYVWIWGVEVDFGVCYGVWGAKYEVLGCDVLEYGCGDVWFVGFVE